MQKLFFFVYAPVQMKIRSRHSSLILFKTNKILFIYFRQSISERAVSAFKFNLIEDLILTIYPKTCELIDTKWILIIFFVKLHDESGCNNSINIFSLYSTKVLNSFVRIYATSGRTSDRSTFYCTDWFVITFYIDLNVSVRLPVHVFFFFV